MSKFTRRSLLSAGVMTLIGPALFNDKSLGAVPGFEGHPAVKAAILNRQTTIFNIANLGATQTLLLVVNGVLTEVHARKNGIYHTKDPARSSSLKTISPVDFNRLINAAGGINQWVNGTARANNFYALYNSLGNNTLPRQTAACPADFATKTPAQKALIQQSLNKPINQKYAPCFRLSLNDVLIDTFGAPSAMARDDTLMFFRVSPDDFFSQWTFEYNTQGGYYGFNAFGVRAIWGIGE